MNVEREFDNTEEKVRHVLTNHEDARNDDDLLIWIVKKHVDGANLNDFREYKETTNAETIRRVRAKVQNDDGELLPTDAEVLKKRSIREERIKEYFSMASETRQEWKRLNDD